MYSLPTVRAGVGLHTKKGNDMKLAIITDGGIVVLVTDDIQDYDLSKPMPKAIIVGEIEDTIDNIHVGQRYGDTP